MNILFFLTPKSEVEFVYNDDTLQHAIDMLEKSTYSALPIINHKGEYKGTISEGDVLWTLKNGTENSIEEWYETKLSKINHKQNNKPVKANAQVKDLIYRAVNQNFVPVIDDDDVFIGIVKRRDVLQYYFDQAQKTKAKN
ncbi:MAG TPA: CBS domain-containing protein [Lachnospiraceae bacterium]|nr:CBS domain-containing protein [Lachnospiraceae bacterium]